MKKILNIILNTLYPPKCLLCRRLLGILTEKPICDECRKKLKFITDGAVCEKCGKPLVSYGEKKRCYHCLNETHFYFHRILSCFEYDGDIKNSILRYKDNPIPVYADFYGECLYKIYENELSDKGIDFVIGVPADKTRLKKRGEDPIELLCETFSKLSGVRYYKNCLKKVRKTKKQAKLSYAERQTNLKDSLRANNPSEIKDRIVLLIDDVCTTRATIKECSRELKFSGAKRVYVLTVATTLYRNK